MKAVLADFDRIAEALARGDTPSLSAAERFLLRQVPKSARCALDVGCGDGRVASALAASGIATLGLDISPGMIALARERARGSPLLDFRITDISVDAPPAPVYDVVVSVAMAHHLPLDHVVKWLRAAVAPGGSLLIQDVVDRPGLRHLPANALGLVASRLRHLLEGARGRREIEALYAAHGAEEQYLRPEELWDEFRPLLPGCRIHHHLEWRYTVVWSNGSAG